MKFSEEFGEKVFEEKQKTTGFLQEKLMKKVERKQSISENNF